MDAPIKPFNLAIVGGGMAGLSLAIALEKHKIPITVYERAPSFGEVGAGMAFEPTFVRTMELINPEIKEGFLRCCIDKMPDPPKWFDVRISDRRKADSEGVVWEKKDGTKRKLDEVIFTIDADHGPRGGIYRAHFLEELKKLIQPGVARFGKKLLDVTEAEDGSGDAVLHFDDGTTAQHTAVIGCDGIKSRTREIVLGKEDARPVYSGKYVYRGTAPLPDVLQNLGDEELTTPQMYCGHKGHLFTFPIANNTLSTIVAIGTKDEWTDDEWVVKRSKEEMLADYADFTDRVKAILNCVKNADVWALFHHKPARTFYQTKPRICLIGDAAHATTPHQGVGAGMCIEDSYVLSELLGKISSADELEKAFHAYQEVRRPRVKRLIESSQEAGWLWDLEGPEGNDFEAFERNATTRLHWIWSHDVRTDVERAQEMMAIQPM